MTDVLDVTGKAIRIKYYCPQDDQSSTIMYIYNENYCLGEQTRISKNNHYCPKDDQSSTVIHIYILQLS